ncbi:hypothetical protein HMPREF1868_01023 [Olsenella sp. DNF00959]|nr:hypothetical protein HMPREF1868_01023 [Olsenella sp. DNF00959]
MHAALADVGDGLDAAVRVEGEAGGVVVGVVLSNESSIRKGSKASAVWLPSTRTRLTPPPSMVLNPFTTLVACLSMPASFLWRRRRAPEVWTYRSPTSHALRCCLYTVRTG